ncbi:hypothetical protein MBLNU230_g2530t1 [Neophaeotheca triangularis]
MGVTSLWQIVQPCARPIKLETLNRKRLAVDASIWIYQFLKAVRDKEGNALRNSHVVGFFRRICKLLYFGIKPVFVFDGGAPALKRQTIGARKSRREGRREDAVRTAGKLLAVQMQRRAEEEDAKRREEQQRRQPVEEEEAIPEEGLVYVDELQMSQQERQQNRKFKKKDQYHLPEMDTSMNDMGGPDDPRVMSLEDLEAYARQFDTGEDINVYDFSKIDYDSAFFMSLPASDRYNILNAARLRSRLRMGHSKEQLDSMFPDRMAFSKFQIERVTERNELTQRLMNINGPGDDAAFGINGAGRVAGEKGREYVLVKNDGVEGGWALGVIGDEGKQEKPIDIDAPAPVAKDEDEWEDDDAFEDVPIEGLNRLPKQSRPSAGHDEDVARQRRALYNSRRQSARKKAKAKKAQQAEDPNSLFIAEEPSDDGEDMEENEVDWQDAEGELFGETNEDEELNRAIALSLQRDHRSPEHYESQDADTDRAIAMPLEEQQGDAHEDNDMLDAFQQSAVEESRPIPKSSGRGIASLVNQRAHKIAPESQEVTSFGVPVPKPDYSDSEDDTIDFQAALAESRKSKRKPSPPSQARPTQPARPARQTDAAKSHGFSGPLPFEKLDLGSSLLGRKKAQQRQDEQAGGFENPDVAEKPAKKNAEPLPPWFSGELEEDIAKQRNLEADDRQRAKDFDKQYQFQSRGENRSSRKNENEIIDLDAEDEPKTSQKAERNTIIDLEDEQASIRKSEPINIDAEAEGAPEGTWNHPQTIVQDPELRMGDMADAVRAEPPESSHIESSKPDVTTAPRAGPFIADDSDEEMSGEPSSNITVQQPEQSAAPHVPTQSSASTLLAPEDTQDPQTQPSTTPQAQGSTALSRSALEGNSEDEQIAWSESEDGSPVGGKAAKMQPLPHAEPAGGHLQQEVSRSLTPEMEFEDVAGMGEENPPEPKMATSAEHDDVGEAGSVPASGLAKQETLPEGGMEDIPELDEFYDPEEEELLRTLAAEAGEHARFASSLNNKTQEQNVQDYEKELKQLRSQQKKDRRDADEVTHIMVTECQQLLKLFGLPYVTAPMEAEAQCAELVNSGLVDGIVTDDSDCFLFGGTRIYKNMFNQAKFVECYLASDFEKEFDLTRQKLINVAHLLGSDYTEGLPGVGPVTALELIAEFGSLDAFKEWYSGVQDTSIPKSADANSAFRKKFRRQASKLFLPPAFPDPRVDAAYLEPEVDADPEPFQWGVPDLDALRSFLMATIGWSQERTDEVLVPVIRDMNRRMDEGTQANLTRYFEGSVGLGAAGGGGSGQGQESFAPRKRVQGSKRMGSALTRLAEKAKGGRQSAEAPADDNGALEGADAEASNGAKSSGQGSKKRNSSARQADTATSEVEEGSDFEQPPRKSKKQTAASSSKGKGKNAKERRKKIQEAA